MQVREVETAMSGWNVKTKQNVSDIKMLTSVLEVESAACEPNNIPELVCVLPVRLLFD